MFVPFLYCNVPQPLATVEDGLGDDFHTPGNADALQVGTHQERPFVYCSYTLADDDAADAHTTCQTPLPDGHNAVLPSVVHYRRGNVECAVLHERVVRYGDLHHVVSGFLVDLKHQALFRECLS